MPNDGETFEERQARIRAHAKAQEESEARAEVLRQARVQRRVELQAKASINFDTLGQRLEQATTREARVELGRQRAALAPYTGRSYVYTSHCWNCKEPISSEVQAQCLGCEYCICSSCGACFCTSPQETWLPDFDE